MTELKVPHPVAVYYFNWILCVPQDDGNRTRLSQLFRESRVASCAAVVADGLVECARC